jgi:hypothetical protein
MVEALVIERLERLRHLPRQQLLELPPVSEDETSVEGSKIKVTTYQDTLEDGRYLIVVQGIVAKWLGLSSTVCARGFVLTMDDQRINAEESMLWSFL